MQSPTRISARQLLTSLLALGIATLLQSCGGKSSTNTTAAPDPANSQKSYVMATATTGGTYYPVGVAIATLTSMKLADSKGVRMTAITSAGSGENIQLLQSKEVEFGILQGLFGAMAWQGSGKYQGQPQKHLRSVTMLWENVEHFVVKSELAPSGNILDLKQLSGKKLSIGKRGSGTEGSGRNILAALGFDLDKDFQLEYLGYGPSATALQDKRIVGMNAPAGPPVGAVTRAYSAIGKGKLRILDFTDEQLAAINQTYPVWSRYTIKAGIYPGQEQPIQTIAQPNFLAVHQDVDADAVYEIVRNIYDNLPFLVNSHKATTAMSLERAIVGLPVPLHPGAARYFNEKGIAIPAALVAKE